MKKHYAVITGASSGIGRAFAKELANEDYRLVLVARRKERLEELAQELRKNGTESIIITADLSKKEECLRLLEELKKLPVGIFINNAGFGDCGSFTQTDTKKELEMIDVNIKAMHLLMKRMLLQMREQGGGYILNVASSAGLLPAGPYMATYYATKNYIVSLSLAIYEELKNDNSNVKISIFCPGPVDTNFNNVANVKFNLKSLSSEYASKYAIDNMFKDKVIILPPNMKVNHLLTKISPTNLVLFVNSKIQRRKIEK